MSTDRFQSEFVAQVLRSEAASIADRAAGLMIDQGLHAHWGPDPRLHWRDTLRARVLELAACIAALRPDDLVARAAWSRAAMVARGVNPADLALSLWALREAALDVIPDEDAPLVARPIDGAIRALSAPSPQPPAELVPGAPHGRLAASYLVAILEGDRRRAVTMLREAVEAGSISVREVYSCVLAPVLREMGRMWHLGEVNVAEEHFATATTLMAMSFLGPLAPCAPACGRTLLAGSVAGNAHEVGVRMVADRFEWAGWRVIYLGPDIPPEDLAQAAVDFQVDAVALSASLMVHLDSLEASIAAIRGARPEALVLVGGAGLSGDADLAARLGADALARDPDEALALAESALAGRVGGGPGRA